MKRLWFILVTFPLGVLALLLAWLTLTEGGLNWVYLQLRQQQAFSLDAGSVEGRLIGPLRVSELWLESDGVSLQVEHLGVELSLWKLLLGQVDLHDVQLDDVQVILPPAGDNATPQPPTFDIRLPLQRINLERLRINGLQLSRGDVEVEIRRVSGMLHLDAQQLHISQFELQTAEHQLNLQGRATLAENLPMDLSVQWRAGIPGQPVLSGSGRVHGDLDKLRLQQVVRSPTQVQLDAEVLSPLTALRWQADVQVKDFRSLQWQLPVAETTASTTFSASGDLETARAKGKAQVTQALSGPLALDIDVAWSSRARVEIHDLRVVSRQSDSKLQAKGWWRPGQDGGEVDVALSWSALRWPLQAEQEVLSPVGQGRLRGVLDDYRFTLSSDSPMPRFADAKLQVSGHGNRDGLRFEPLRLSALEGEVQASGQLDWAGVLSWQADVQGSGINPRGLQAEWPGRLDFELSQQGRYESGQLHAAVNIESLRGELRGYPVALSGAFEWRDRLLAVNRMVFKSGDSVVQASGEINDRLDLQWKVHSPRLEELHPELQGEIDASGSLTGSRTQPRIRASVKARALAYRDYRSQLLEGEVELAMHDPLGASGDLRFRELDLAGQRLDGLSISGDSSSLRLEADAGDYSLRAALAGKLQDDRWQGRLLQADIHAARLKSWRMKSPAGLSIDHDGRVELEQGCWHSEQQASLCATASGAGADWRSRLSLADFPLQLLSPWLPVGLEADSTVNGVVDAALAGGRVTGQAAVRLSAGRIRYPVQEDELETVPHQGGRLDMQVSAQGVISTMRLDLDGGDQLQAEIRLPGANLLAFDARRQAIAGTLSANLSQLALLGQQIPEVNKLSGRVGLQVKLSGRLAQPAFDGSLTLDDGRLVIPRLGLTVSGLTLQAQANDLDRVHFRLQALSGDGRLNVAGNAWRRSDGEWTSEFDINGSNVEVSRIPEARIQASPALKVVVSPYQVEVSGRIEIPYAHIEPRDFTTAARVSPDVVIVGAEQPPVRKWRITSRVQLVLGERVHFNGFGFEGRLNGQVLVEESAGLPTRASGEIGIVDGRYRAYGQRLAIEQGRLLFSGGPLTSPGVDARAVRKVGSITAGVRARGQLQRPQVELFSTPAMGQTDILSYLLLGRPLDKASDSDGAMMAQAALALGLTGGDRLARALRDRFGLDEMRVESSDTGDQASLVVGRYLSPRLYVSYGIGLIEDFNTLMVRYSISERWQLKAESGEAHGADLIYTIER